MISKICFIIPFYGKIPSYIDLFLDSCKKNEDYTFIFFTDIQFNTLIPRNVKIVDLPFKDLVLLVEQKTGIRPNILNYYKIVDFKPAYGLIFEDYIKKFDFWGILDIDIVLGNLSSFINEQLLCNYDIITTLDLWISGACTIFRNCHTVNIFFKNSKDWQMVFSSEKHFAFDECGRLNEPDGHKIYERLMNGHSILHLDTDIEALTHLLKNEKKKKGIRVYFNKLICEHISGIIIKHDKNKLIIFNPGPSDYKVGQEILLYHFVNDKKRSTFLYPNWEQIPECYFITQFGFFTKKSFKYFKLLKIGRVIKGQIFMLIFYLPTKILNKITKVKL